MLHQEAATIRKVPVRLCLPNLTHSGMESPGCLEDDAQKRCIF